MKKKTAPKKKPASDERNRNADLLTITNYGRHRGVSHTAVNRAIETGRLTDKSVVYLANGTKRIKKKEADVEWDSNTNPDHWRSKYSTGGGTHGATVDEGKTKEESGATLNAAKRAKAVFDAKLAELDYRKKSCELVERKKVYDTLFGWGKELRNELLAVPDRIIDDVLAAPSRNESLTLLYDELAEVLQKITEIDGREIVSDR